MMSEQSDDSAVRGSEHSLDTQCLDMLDDRFAGIHSGDTYCPPSI